MSTRPDHRVVRGLKFDDQIWDLENGDMIEGGTFLEALSTEPVTWTLVAKGKAEKSSPAIVSAEWMGIKLGSFHVSPKTGSMTRE